MTHKSQLLSRKLDSARYNCGLSKAELCRRAGLSYSYINMVVMAEKSPSAINLFHLAKALNVSLDYLLDDSIPVDIDMGK